MAAEDSNEWLIAVCGLNCAKCDIHQAGHGNEEVRDEIVRWFKKERDETIDLEKIRCEGCRGPLAIHWGAECKMMLCARKRGFQYCFQCEDFPCTEVKEFSSDGTSHHRKTVENAQRMKEIGLEAWIIEQKRKGQCAFCP